MGDAVNAYEEKRRPLPNPACSWCGHPPHGQQCPQAILTEELLWEIFRVKTRIELSPDHGKKHIHFLV